MKKEIEKAAEHNYPEGDVWTEEQAVIRRLAFKNGAKWQAKRMYSKKDMEEAFTNGLNRSFDSDFDRWFEQFKKK